MCSVGCSNQNSKCQACNLWFGDLCKCLQDPNNCHNTGTIAKNGALVWANIWFRLEGSYPRSFVRRLRTTKPDPPTGNISHSVGRNEMHLTGLRPEICLACYTCGNLLVSGHQRAKRASPVYLIFLQYPISGPKGLTPSGLVTEPIRSKSKTMFTLVVAQDHIDVTVSA